MNPTHENAPPGPRAVACEVVAHAITRVPLAAVADLRRQPGPPGSPPLPNNFLKHADEQTVAGVSALFHAIANYGLQGTAFTDWGVLGAPRFLARSAMIVGLQKFLAEGAWGVSPHMIPHRSLHSLSGTVSLALKSNGPNFGVGGGPGGAVEVLLGAVAMLHRTSLPGVWVVWTALEPEGAMDLAGRGDPATTACGLAVALAPASGGGPRLQIETNPTGRRAAGYPDYFYLERLLSELPATQEPGRRATEVLTSGLRVALEWPRRMPSDLVPVCALPTGCAVEVQL